MTLRNNGDYQMQLQKAEKLVRLKSELSHQTISRPFRFDLIQYFSFK